MTNSILTQKIDCIEDVSSIETSTINFLCEYRISHIDSYAFINTFVIVKENLGLQCENDTSISKKEKRNHIDFCEIENNFEYFGRKTKYQYRYMLQDQARNYRRCMSNGFSSKKNTKTKERAKFSVNFVFFLITSIVNP